MTDDTQNKPVDAAAAPTQANPLPAPIAPSTGGSDGALAVTGLAGLAQYARAAALNETASAPRISMKAGQMKYRDQAMPGNQMDVVIMCGTLENAYYLEAFDDDEVKNPVCFAMGTVLEDMAPHDNSIMPQNDRCKGCPQFKWGSEIKGKKRGRGKACKEVRQLALLPADATKGEKEAKDGELVLLKIPVTSVKNWSNYVNRLANAYKLPHFAVITTIKAIPDEKTQFRIEFEIKGVVEDMAVINVFIQRQEESMKASMTPHEPAEPPEEDTEPAPKAKYER